MKNDILVYCLICNKYRKLSEFGVVRLDNEDGATIYTGECKECLGEVKVEERDDMW